MDFHRGIISTTKKEGEGYTVQFDRVRSRMFDIFNINCITVGGNPINGHPSGSNPKFWPKMTPNMGDKNKHFE